MKVVELFEGAYVVKNQAGVEKRFKDADSEAAVAWKNSGAKAPAKVAAPKVDKKAQLDDEVSLVSYCLTTADGWGEMDSFDVMSRKVFPAMIKGVRKDPQKYGDAFKEALDKAVSRDYGIWDKIRPWLDKAAKRQGYKSFDNYVDEMNSYGLDEALEEAKDQAAGVLSKVTQALKTLGFSAKAREDSAGVKRAWLVQKPVKYDFTDKAGANKLAKDLAAALGEKLKVETEWNYFSIEGAGFNVQTQNEDAIGMVVVQVAKGNKSGDLYRHGVDA